MDPVTADAFLRLITTGGAVTVLAINVWAFATGRVLARSVHDARVKELGDDRDHWRGAYLTLAAPVENLLVSTTDLHAAAAAASTAAATVATAAATAADAAARAAAAAAATVAREAAAAAKRAG